MTEAQPKFSEEVYKAMVLIAGNCPRLWDLIRAQELIHQLRYGDLALQTCYDCERWELAKMYNENFDRRKEPCFCSKTFERRE